MIGEVRKDLNSKMSQPKPDKAIPDVVIIDDEPRPAAPGLEPLSSDDDL